MSTEESGTADIDISTDFNTNPVNEVEEKRTTITRLLQEIKGNQGDDWFVIPKQFLKDFLNIPVTDFQQLHDKIAPIDFNSITTLNDETITKIPPQVYHHFKEWFGVLGSPIRKSLIINESSGELEIDKYEIEFLVHQLGKKTTQSYFRNSSRQYHQQNDLPIPLYVSQTKTFCDLSDLIKEFVLKSNKKTISDFRIWIVNTNAQLPFLIPISTFIFEIEKKCLITLNHFSNNLSAAGFEGGKGFTLVVEVKERDFYPINNYITQFEDGLRVGDQGGGNLGLSNLGNTCYMNSALQCLLHVPEINDYFFYNIYANELNNTNPLGYRGEVAKSFGSLLKQAFDTSKITSSSLSPREFKSTIGRFSSMFSGYLQQDSQELLSWLLDALHEDLNRIVEKPYCEKPELKDDEINDPNAIVNLAMKCWDQHKARNDSIIVDLFTGLYQSTLVCPDCDKTSITFDPFNDITLPLPVNKKWYHTFTVVDLSSTSILPRKIMKLEVELQKTSNYDDLINYLSNFLKINQEFLFLFEIFQNSVYLDFQLDYNKNKFFPIGDLIRDTDDIVVYVIPHEQDEFIVPVFNAVEDPDASYNMIELFGIPLFITIGKDEVNSFGTIRRKLIETNSILTNVNLTEEYDKAKQSMDDFVDKKFYSKKDFPLLNTNQDDSDGYDSDVSLANPFIDEDFGFNILSNEMELHQRTRINVPRCKPSLSQYKLLADKLNDTKRKFYHYQSYKADQEKAENDEYIIIDKDIDTKSSSSESATASATTASTLKKTPHQSLVTSSDEESEVGLGSLFDSTPNLIVPPASNYSESTKPSNMNSPIEPTTESKELISPNTILLCNWSEDVYKRVFKDESPIIETLDNSTLQENKLKYEKLKKSKVSLYDCLKSFSQPEVLGEHDLWFCPRCKDHKRATKTIQLWSTGDILTIHLKRFHSARAFSDKIDVVVDFPIEGLDISQYTSGPNDSNTVYDLIAVDNHYGGLGGGHYTASVKNFRDSKWYYFNDSRVSEINDTNEVISSAAYLLFYRKRTSEDTIGNNQLRNLLTQGRLNYQSSINDKNEKLSLINQEISKFEESEETLTKTQFTFEDEEINYGDEEEEHDDDEDDGFRKQRLLSKDQNSNKFVQIRSNGSETHTSSPVPMESNEEEETKGDLKEIESV